MRELVAGHGKVSLQEVPAPLPALGEVLVRNTFSAVSIGTERGIIQETGLTSLGRIRRDPSLVKQAFAVLRNAGLKKTVEVYGDVMGGQSPLGYSSCGRVLAVGRAVTDFKVDDLVACGGSGVATHADFVAVPRNLVALVPGNVAEEEACLATIGSIAVHGIRRSGCSFGDSVGIIGLGLLGSIASKVAVACGLNVIAFDSDSDRARLADTLQGVSGFSRESDFVAGARNKTRGHGVDAVLICTASSDTGPVDLALETVRNEGKVVLVGTAEIDVERDKLYTSEAEVSVSRSYGPGRYDPLYEEKGIDYPYEYVRWTENRNMEFVLSLLSTRRLVLQDLVSDIIPIEEAPRFYEELTKGKRRPLAAIIRYDNAAQELTHRVSGMSVPRMQGDMIGVGVIGAGAFAQSVILPILRTDPGVRFIGICNKKPLSAKQAADRWKASFSTTDCSDIIRSNEVSLVVVATPHSQHAEAVISCIENRKPVFVEKPLAVSSGELDDIEKAYRSHGGFVAVGFNRRFSPLSATTLEILSRLEGPMVVDYEVHVPTMAPNHWVNDPEVGGGRMIGEGCHFLDFFRYLVPCRWTSVWAKSPPIRRTAGSEPENFVVSIGWDDGSVSTLKYVTIGSSSLPKETVTIHRGNTTVVINDFKELRVSGGQSKLQKLGKPDKGHKEEMRLLLSSIRTGKSVVQSLEDASESMRLTFQAHAAIRQSDKSSSREHCTDEVESQ